MENVRIRNAFIGLAGKLGEVTVSGKENMTTLLSCISFCEQMAEQVMEDEGEPEQK